MLIKENLEKRKKLKDLGVEPYTPFSLAATLPTELSVIVENWCKLKVQVKLTVTLVPNFFLVMKFDTIHIEKFSKL